MTWLIRRNPAVPLLILMVGFMLMAPSLLAQNEAQGPKNQDAKAKDAKDEKAAKGEQQPETLLEMVTAGGPVGLIFMGVLALFSMVAVAVIFERLFNVRYGRLLPISFVNELQELLRKRPADPKPFRVLARSSETPIAKILRAGLTRVGRSVTEVEKTMEDVGQREISALRSRIRPLSVLAAVAPLVGLLGTVVGMVIAFRNTSMMEMGDDKATALAKGIYLALITTVAGLTIAIPTQIFAAYFSTRTDKIMRETDEVLIETIPWFTQMEEMKFMEEKEKDAEKTAESSEEKTLVAAE